MSVKSLMFLTSALITAGLVIEPLAANAAGLHQVGTWGTPAGLGRAVSNLRCDGVPGVANLAGRPLPGVGTTRAFRAPPGVTANIGGSGGFTRPLNVLGHDGAGGDGGRFEMHRTIEGGGHADGARGAFGSRPLNVMGGQPMNVETGNGSNSGDVTNNFVKNIDASKQISIYKPVTVNNTIDASKTISIYKPITINNPIIAITNPWMTTGTSIWLATELAVSPMAEASMEGRKAAP